MFILDDKKYKLKVTDDFKNLETFGITGSLKKVSGTSLHSDLAVTFVDNSYTYLNINEINISDGQDK